MVPTFLPYVVLTGTALSLAAIFYGLNRALVEASWPRPERLRTLTISAAILLGWLAITVGLSGAGFYHVTQKRHPAHPRWTAPADPDRLLPDLSLGARQTHPRRVAATMERRRPVLSGARRRVPDPVCRRPIARPIRLACRSGRYRRRPISSPGRLCLYTSAARCGGPRQSVERPRHPRSHRRRDD